MNRATVSGAQGDLVYELVAGSLPAGLSFSPITGNIYGTPTEEGTFGVAIRASNSQGQANVSVDLIVRNPLPEPSYTPGTVSYPLGTPIATLAPANIGGVIYGWSITPNLSANTGLLFNTTTGKITGTPTQTSAPVEYIVTAQGALESNTCAVVIGVTLTAPTVSYANTLRSYPVGSAITPLTKTGASGKITAYSIAPTLPAGLLFNTTTGAILGTPTTVVAATNYVITATGPGGTGKDTVNIATTLNAPTVSYPAFARYYSVGTPISEFSKTGTTGAITSYSIAPALPTGLLFNTTTGRITGTPAVISELSSYMITAHGPGGTGTRQIELATTENPPVITFEPINEVDTVLFVRGAAITPFRPINNGGPVLGWSIGLGTNGNSLTANTGLVFNPTTGKILGTPVYVGAPMTYTITATGWLGSQSQAAIAIGTTAPPSKLALAASGASALVGVGRAINGRAGRAGIYTLRKPAKETTSATSLEGIRE